ncbi:hypothetical protein V5799_006051 [Amblyomma americanum]|uniref:Uncharacterized protein n=1 Tax=Amblyomma americanum TaxID=6943 RepID=A0AAQ4DXI5_AMBAM
MKTFLACSLLVAALFTCGGAASLGGSSSGGQGSHLPGKSGSNSTGPISGGSGPGSLPGEIGGENPGPFGGSFDPNSLPGKSGSTSTGTIGGSGRGRLPGQSGSGNPGIIVGGSNPKNLPGESGESPGPITAALILGVCQEKVEINIVTRDVSPKRLQGASGNWSWMSSLGDISCIKWLISLWYFCPF